MKYRKNRITGKSRLGEILAVMLACAVLTGCGEKTLPAGNSDQSAKDGAENVSGITFTDDLGREVTVESQKKVAVMLGSFADIWMLAGGSVAAATKDAWDSQELDLGEDVANIGSFLNPDLEKLIAAAPDLVIASTGTKADLEMEDLLKQAGITVAYFDVSDFKDYLRMLKICTDLTGRGDLYEKYGTTVETQIEDVLKRVDGRAPRILFLRASSGTVKAKGSKDTVGGEMLAALGCVNIADSRNGLLEDLSLEAIISEDPEYIFVTTQGTDTEAAMQAVEELLTSNPAWSSLSAVKNGKYYVLDKRLYNSKPNARWGEAYEILADILYPVSGQ